MTPFVHVLYLFMFYRIAINVYVSFKASLQRHKNTEALYFQ